MVFSPKVNICEYSGKIFIKAKFMSSVMILFNAKYLPLYLLHNEGVGGYFLQKQNVYLFFFTRLLVFTLSTLKFDSTRSYRETVLRAGIISAVTH